MKIYFVYILTNAYRTVLYIGVTNDLVRRVAEHRAGTIKGFTAKCNCKSLVYYESFGSIELAIGREKQLKAGSRKRKVELIEKANQDWRDLWESICP